MDSFKKAAIVLNGFIHDFATGYWLSSLIAVYLLHGYHSSWPEVSPMLREMEGFFFWNSMGAVVAIFATGGMRTFTYVDNFYGPQAESTRRRMLVIKHLLLFAILGTGSLWGYSMAFG